MAWLAALKRNLLHSYDKANTMHTRQHFPRPPAAILAKKWIRECGWTPVPNDKDPGYTFVKKDDSIQAHRSILEASSYQCDAEIPRLRQTYLNLCKKFEIFDGKAQAQDIMRTAMDNLTGWASRLKLACKTHKDPGEVSFRNIHAAPGAPTRGLSLRIAQELREALLSQCPYLLSSSEDFVQRIRLNTQRFPHCKLAKLDIKHFYMSGTSDFLAEHASNIIHDGDRRAFIRDACLWLLQNQFIKSWHEPEAI